MYIINKYINKSIVVNSEGTYAKCDDSDNDLKPYCEYRNSSGFMQREYCFGKCRIQDVHNYWGNVSFCCEFDHGHQNPSNEFDIERHCCDNYDACRDNFEQKNDCNSM